MAVNLPPPPTGQEVNSWQWRDWFNRLVGLVQTAPSGGFGPGSDGIAGQILESGGPGNPPVWSSTRVEQSFTNAFTVTVNHSFGRRPLVQILDATGAMMIPMQVKHLSSNTFTVSFSISTSGTVIALAL